MTIIISKGGSSTKKIDKSDFEKENYLQEYIHKNPESIPVYEIQEDKRLFVAAREFPTESGPIDALAIDKDGEIYIVETKLYKNPDKRTVVAQALDYGAALWKHYGDFSKFHNILNNKVQSEFKVSFKEKSKVFFEIEDEEYQNMLDAMSINLREGNIKFVILMDSIDERLKDLILYVNQNSKFDIFSVQLEYYKFEEYEIMIPKIFGIEVKKNISASSRKWDETSFIFEFKQRKEVMHIQVTVEILNWARAKSLSVKWGKGETFGTFYPNISCKGKERALFGVYTSGKIEIVFRELPFSSEAQKGELLRRLNEIPGISLREKAVTTWGGFPLSALHQADSLYQFFKAYEWAISEMINPRQ